MRNDLPIVRRGTTPTVKVRVKSKDGTALDLTDAYVYLTLKENVSGGHEITKSGENVTVEVSNNDSLVSADLTQSDTLALTAGREVEVQVRGKTQGGKALATSIPAFKVGKILLDGEI